MATKNRAYLLKRAIESVLAQDFSSVEVVIVDDASEDETLVLLEHYSRSDERVRWLKKDISQGAAAARNKVLNEPEKFAEPRVLDSICKRRTTALP